MPLPLSYILYSLRRNSVPRWNAEAGVRRRGGGQGLLPHLIPAVTAASCLSAQTGRCNRQCPSHVPMPVAFLASSLGHVRVESLQSCSTLCDPLDCSPQAPLSMGFSRQGYCSGLPCAPPGDLPDPGIEPASLTSTDGFFSATWEAHPCKSWFSFRKNSALLTFAAITPSHFLEGFKDSGLLFFAPSPFLPFLKVPVKKPLAELRGAPPA